MKTTVNNFSQVKSNKVWRLEAEYYTQPSLIVSDYFLGVEALKSIDYGTSEALNEIGEGFPVLRLNEFDGLFIKKPEKYCNRISLDMFSFLSLKKDDLLICRTNGNPKLVGKTAIVPRNYDYAFASYLFRVRPDTSMINSATLAVYLNSNVGRAEIEKNLMVSNQSNFSPEKFRDIRIPKLHTGIQELVEKIVYNAFDYHQKAISFYAGAEQILLLELGLHNWAAKCQLSFVRKFSDTQSTDRMDAEYYQPQYDEIIKAVKTVKNYARLDDDLVSIKKCVEPGSEAYQDSGVPFVRVSNLSKFGINDDNQQFISESLYESLKMHQPQKGEILLSKDATPGIAYYLSDVPGKMIPSSGVLRLTVKDAAKIIPEYLTLVLNSVVVQKQIERDVGGSVINHWLVDQVKNAIVPLLDDEAQKEISGKIAESFLKRKQSRSLLEIAKSGVEMAIEKSEEEALEWINQGVKSYA